MKAIQAEEGWFSIILEQREVKIPEIKDNEVLIKVWAVGVNRDDIYDVATSANGFCPGLECSGIIQAVGRNVSCWKVGERVCAILEGGAYAEQVAVTADLVLPLPDDIDLSDAAGLPYASCCIWFALFKMHTPKTLEDKRILIYEGCNGIGLLAIQYAKYMGLKVIASTGNDIPANYDCYGADFCVDHTSRNFGSDVLRIADNLGVDFVLDYGACQLQRNIDCCRTSGKVAIVDFCGGKRGNVDLDRLRRKHAEFKVYNLRSRDFRFKASVVEGLKTHLWPAILRKEVVPVTDHYFSASEVVKAFNLVKTNSSIGKIIVRMDFEETETETGCHLKMQ